MGTIGNRGRAALLGAWLVLGAREARAGARDFGAIDAYVREQMAAHGIPGLALAVLEDGRPVHLAGFGVAGPGGAPVTTATPFVLGSLSKAFTAVAVMQQVEAGRLALDAPVQRYLPWFRVRDPAASRAITVRHLLHHTSGLPTSAPRAAGPAPTLEAHVRALADVALVAPPGTLHQYASPNYQVLGLLVERASGEPFATYVERHVLAPLGMRHGATDVTHAPGLAAGHRLWAGLPVAHAAAHEADRLPTASLIASAEDLARFLAAQMRGSGTPLLSPASLAALHAPGAPAADGFSYAMGWRVGTTAGAPSLWHGGSLPGYRAALVLQPEERWGVVVLSNLGSPLEDTTRLIARGVTARLRHLPTPEDGFPLRRASSLAAAAVALACALMAWRLARVPRWWSRVRQRLGPGGARRRLAVRLAVESLLPALVLALAPRWFGVGPRAMAEAAPDVALGLGLLLLLGTLLPAWRLWHVLRAPAAT